MGKGGGQLVVSGVVKRFDDGAGGCLVLDGVSFTVEPGETVAIVGPSGSGKSTLLNMIGSLDRPTAGTILLGDTNVTALAGDALARFRATAVGFVFQDHHLLPQLTALENILLAGLAAGRRTDGEGRARDLIRAVGVDARADAFPSQLSGGERQRVAVARALFNRPGLLLCDEPTGNLDHEAAAQVVGLFLDLARQQRVAVIMVTHNLQLAGRLARVLELRDGKLQAGALPAPSGSRL